MGDSAVHVSSIAGSESSIGTFSVVGVIEHAMLKFIVCEEQLCAIIADFVCCLDTGTGIGMSRFLVFR